MKTTRLILSFIILLLVSIRSLLPAQVDIEPALSIMYDDNINNDYLQVRDRITTAGLSTGYRWESDRSSLHTAYSGTLHYYQTAIDRTNNYHSFGLEYSHTSGHDQGNIFTAGIGYDLGFNHGQYSFYDHTRMQAILNYKQFLTDELIHKTGYTFRSLRFSQLADFNYAEHAVMSSLSAALPTETTVILQGDLGSKFYSSATSTADGGMQRSRMTIAPSVTQLAGSLRIGQSLGESTGLSLSGQYQWNLQKQTRYLSSDYGFVADDELFDDHYGYEGAHLSMLLTHIFSESLTMKAGAGIQSRLYSSLSAYDLEGNETAPQRKDTRTYVNLYCRKSFDMGFSLTAVVDLIGNASNDSYHSYNNTAVTLELGVPF